MLGGMFIMGDVDVGYCRNALTWSGVLAVFTPPIDRALSWRWLSACDVGRVGIIINECGSLRLIQLMVLCSDHAVMNILTARGRNDVQRSSDAVVVSWRLAVFTPPDDAGSVHAVSCSTVCLGA